MFKGILKELKEALTATPMPQPPEGVIPIQADHYPAGTVMTGEVVEIFNGAPRIVYNIYAQ